eukprot:5648576-Prymnesium_polylepis.2
MARVCPPPGKALGSLLRCGATAGSSAHAHALRCQCESAPQCCPACACKLSAPTSITCTTRCAAPRRARRKQKKAACAELWPDPSIPASHISRVHGPQSLTAAAVSGSSR